MGGGRADATATKESSHKKAEAALQNPPLQPCTQPHRRRHKPQDNDTWNYCTLQLHRTGRVRGMEESRKRAKIGGDDESGGAAATSQNEPLSSDVDAAAKIAELQAKMQAMEASHELLQAKLGACEKEKAQLKLEVDELRLEVNAPKSNSHLGENK